MIDRIDLRGLVPLFIGMTVLAVFGLWKLVEIVAWIVTHVRFV
jgi:hypothetical protein